MHQFYLLQSDPHDPTDRLLIAFDNGMISYTHYLHAMKILNVVIVFQKYIYNFLYQLARSSWLQSYYCGTYNTTE